MGEFSDIVDYFRQEGSLLCAIMPSLTEITILQHTGRLSFDQFRKVLSLEMMCFLLYLAHRKNIAMLRFLSRMLSISIDFSL